MAMPIGMVSEKHTRIDADIFFVTKSLINFQKHKFPNSYQKGIN